MSIWVTGDTHGDFTRFSTDNFPQGKNLTKEDYVIILGDCGLIWSQKEDKNEIYWKNWLENKPWTTLFIAGNHCNFDRLEQYPIEEWNGGRVSFLRPSVIYLQYGEIFDIADKKIFALGKAASHDTQHGIIDPADYTTREEMKQACRNLEKEHGGWQFAMYRIKGESWWPQEIPTSAERMHALDNLEKVNNKVDFILTHEAPASDIILLGNGWYKPDEYSKFLEELRCCIDYDRLFFGHYHLNKRINEKDECLYEQIRRIV